MSTYVREKVLRVPLENTGLITVDSQLDYEDILYDIRLKFKDLSSSGTPGKFQFAPTETLYLDYVLECEYDASEGEFGKTRALSEKERAKFKPIFSQIVPDIEMSLVRLVEYCWYNCSEAPDYYDNAGDSFYKEL